MAKRFHFLLTVSAFLFVGCGVGEYTDEMERTRKRLAYLDEENQFLAEPLRVPDVATSIFFRPPKGVALEPDGKPTAEGPQAYRYPWADANVRISPFEVVVVVASAKSKDPLDQQVRDYLGRRAPGEPQTAREETFPNQIDIPGVPPTIAYRRLTLRADEAVTNMPERCVFNYDAYINDAGKVAIIFRQFDVLATKDRWGRLDEKTRYPIVEIEDRTKQLWDKLAKQRPMSLASLLTGSAANTRLSARK